MTTRAFAGRFLCAAALALTITSAAHAENAPGITDVEIKIGQTFAYSGPASSFSAIPKAEAAYFRKINEEGGINGRKINLISLDDGYSPPKSVEQTRKLIEQDEVAFIFQSLGTAPNGATQKYLNAKGVPALFIASPARKFADPANFPWTIGWQAQSFTEGSIFAKYLLREKPNAKVGVLYQNDDFGRDYMRGFKQVLENAKANVIVAEAAYQTTDATIDSYMLNLRASGADVLLDISLPKYAIQAIRKANELNWKPLHILASVSSSVGLTLSPAGLENSVGIVSAQFYKDPTDPQWRDDPATTEWRAFMTKYNPGGDQSDANTVYAYSVAQTLVHVLRKCGNDLSRENIMRQAASIEGLPLPMLLPGIKVATSPTNFSPIREMQMTRFDGQRWQLFGDLLSE